MTESLILFSSSGSACFVNNGMVKFPYFIAGALEVSKIEKNIYYAKPI
jgi:hypothetical protein